MNIQHINRHIAALLYQHDCVIIPTFGGFVANSVPAREQVAKHIIYPPSKKIAFNKKLVYNDGLLANYIAQKQNITYTKANEQIASYVKICNQLLNEGGGLDIENIGRFFYDKERNLQFEADMGVNYLLASYGLTPVRIRPVQRTKGQKAFRDRLAIPPAKETKTKPHEVKKVSSFTLLLVGAVMLTMFNIVLVTQTSVNLSDLNPFSRKSYKVHETIPLIQQPVLKEDVKDLTEAVEAISFAPSTVLPVEKGTEDDPVILKEQVIPSSLPLEVPVEEHNQPLAIAPKDRKFYVVGGCFAYPENAEKMVKVLREDGYTSAAITGKTRGLHIVSYNTFVRKEDAREELKKVRLHQPLAWLYHAN